MSDFIREFSQFFDLNGRQLEQFEAYYEALVEKNRHMNLTAITEKTEVFEKHFWDSLMLGQFIDLSHKSLIDVGTGGGFPGLPLKILYPNLDLTLLDALGKRVDFLKELCGTLGLEQVSCIHARGEDAAKEDDMRERFHIATSRAVSRLNQLCELALPFVQVGGHFLAMKAEDCKDELEEAQKAIEMLGGRVCENHLYTLPGSNISRRLIVIEKINSTPSMYPRRFAKIQKNPL